MSFSWNKTWRNYKFAWNSCVVYKLNEKQKNVIRNRSIPYHLNAMMYYCLCQHVQMRKTQWKPLQEIYWESTWWYCAITVSEESEREWINECMGTCNLVKQRFAEKQVDFDGIHTSLLSSHKAGDSISELSSLPLDPVSILVLPC